MAWPPSLFKDKRWRQTMEEVMGSSSTKESSFLQERGGKATLLFLKFKKRTYRDHRNTPRT